MAEELDDVLLNRVDQARRAALKKLVLGAAYAVPVVASFAMSGLASAGQGCSNLDLCTVPTLTEWTTPVFGVALAGAAVAVVAKKTTES